jgi:hypothetical protein
MGRTQDAEEDGREGVAVVDGEVRDTTWQQLDLDLMLAALPRAPGAPPRVLTAAASGSVRSFPQMAAELAPLVGREPPPKRVPDRAFVSIGRRSTAPVPRHRAGNGILASSANDNQVRSGDKRSMWRDLFFLAILAATVVGAFWSGRMQGYQKVIVVPGPSSFYSQVT